MTAVSDTTKPAVSSSFTVTVTVSSLKALYFMSVEEKTWATVAVRRSSGLSTSSFWPRRFTVCAVPQFVVVNMSVSLVVNAVVLSGPSSRTGPVAVNATDTS